MGELNVLDVIKDLPRGHDLANRLDWTIQKCQETNRPFFILLLQLDNLDHYLRRRPRYTVLNLMKEIYQTLRSSLHSSQFIGSFQNGFAIVVDALDVGRVDVFGQRVANIALKIIREGKYNDLSARWTEIIRQFLFPSSSPILYPRVGWAIYPRDGNSPKHLVKRALYHLKELNK